MPTIEIVEGGISSLSGVINFDKMFNAVSLKFQAIGATSCYVTINKEGAYYSYMYLPTTSNIDVSMLPIGSYTWTVTCSNATFGTNSTATASGTIRRPADASWAAKTSSTGNAWQTLGNYTTVSWAFSAPFDQYYTSANATSCRVQSYGFRGTPINDPENPASFLNGTANYSQSEPALWDSGPGFPTSLVFATFYFQDPHNSPYGIAYYDGYKWKLTCTGGPGNNLVRIMYGVLQ